MEEKIVKKTKLLKEEELYPDGANSPTIHREYRCFCKKGLIIEENTIGFSDHFITIECEKCLKKYEPFIDECGYDWLVYKK